MHKMLMTVMTKTEILKKSETFWKLTLQSEQEQNMTGGESAVRKFFGSQKNEINDVAQTTIPLQMSEVAAAGGNATDSLCRLNRKNTSRNIKNVVKLRSATRSASSTMAGDVAAKELPSQMPQKGAFVTKKVNGGSTP